MLLSPHTVVHTDCVHYDTRLLKAPLKIVSSLRTEKVSKPLCFTPLSGQADKDKGRVLENQKSVVETGYLLGCCNGKKTSQKCRILILIHAVWTQLRWSLLLLKQISSMIWVI